MAQVEIERREVTARPVAVTRSVRWTKVIAETLGYLFLIVSGVAMLLPLFWMVVGGFKEQWEITAVPPVWLPGTWRWDTYWYVLTQSGLGTGYLNSLLVVPLVTVIQVVTSVVCGYAFAKLRFPGRDILFGITLSTLMLPGFLIQIPLFVIIVQLGWLNTYQAVIVPFLFTTFGIFMMRQFMIDLPTEYIDAARIDGSSEIGVIWRIVFPLVREACAALAIFVFIFHWNELFWPLLVLRQRDMFVLPLALFTLQGDYGTYYHQVLAGATLAVIPVLIVYAVLQEQIIRGMTLTGLKG